MKEGKIIKKNILSSLSELKAQIEAEQEGPERNSADFRIKKAQVSSQNCTGTYPSTCTQHPTHFCEVWHATIYIMYVVTDPYQMSAGLCTFYGFTVVSPILLALFAVYVKTVSQWASGGLTVTYHIIAWSMTQTIIYAVWGGVYSGYLNDLCMCLMNVMRHVLFRSIPHSLENLRKWWPSTMWCKRSTGKDARIGSQGSWNTVSSTCTCSRCTQ